MTAPYYHAESSARKFGGVPADYLKIHNWFDQSKESLCGFQHRAVRHHAEGIFEAERVFGVTIINSDGKHIPVRYLGEMHVLEDCGRIPTLSDWLRQIQPLTWMSRGTIIADKKEQEDAQ